MRKTERVEISEEVDVARASSEAQRFAEAVGFKRTDQYAISTAASELARNIFVYAMKGEMTLKEVKKENHKGIEIVAQDQGPGIKDVGKAMKDHFSTGQGLGLGLPGAKRLMDEFMIAAKPGRGTKVTIRKWV